MTPLPANLLESRISFHYRERAGLLDAMACRVANPGGINDRTFIETFPVETAPAVAFV